MQTFSGYRIFLGLCILLSLSLGCRPSQQNSSSEEEKPELDSSPIRAVEFETTDPEEQQVEAIEAFEEAGGRIKLEYDASFQCSICQTISKRPADKPKFLYDCPHCGKSVHMHPRAVALEFKHNREIADEDLAYLAGLPHLEALDLSSQPVTDRVISLLVQLKQLKRLYLTDTDLSASGISRIEGSLPKCYVRN